MSLLSAGSYSNACRLFKTIVCSPGCAMLMNMNSLVVEFNGGDKEIYTAC